MILKLWLSILHRHSPLISHLYKQTVHLQIIPLVTSNLSENNHLLGLGYKTMSSSWILLSMYPFLLFLLFQLWPHNDLIIKCTEFPSLYTFYQVTFHDPVISTLLCIMCIYSVQIQTKLSALDNLWVSLKGKKTLHSSLYYKVIWSIWGWFY